LSLDGEIQTPLVGAECCFSHDTYTTGINQFQNIAANIKPNEADQQIKSSQIASTMHITYFNIF